MADPIVAQKSPYKIELKANYRYAWCSCGRSDFQPFCNGAHSETGGEYSPIVFTAEKDETVYLCGCKHTGEGPRCDGSHKTVE